ncbi:MAG: hypothetical protein KGL01_06270 [Betaproteobacteria bacterium]|nr:hypothetical protein [Betaproteobacteria bacterium]
MNVVFPDPSNPHTTVVFIPNNPLTRHSRAGGNPDDLKISHEVGQHCGFVRFAGCLFLLDSRLRGNDAIFC